MVKETPLSVKLLFLLGDGHLGQMSFNTWKHHTPDMLTAPTMDEPLAIPQAMRTGKPRRLYSLRSGSILHGSETLGSQCVDDGDVLILTDIDDPAIIAAFSKVLADLANISVEDQQKYKESRARAVARGILQGIPWAGPALDALLLGPKSVH